MLFEFLMEIAGLENPYPMMENIPYTEIDVVWILYIQMLQIS